MFLGLTINALAQNTMEVVGTVTDIKGEPIIGATVAIQNATGLGAITDIDGNYKIKVKEYQTLIFTYMGFQSVDKLVKPGMNRIDVQLTEEKVNAVDEVVVVGMGTQKKLP